MVNYDKGDQCPLCNADLSHSWTERDGTVVHGSHRIGIYDRDRDMTVEWQCPHCLGRWPRTEPPEAGFRKTQ